MKRIQLHPLNPEKRLMIQISDTIKEGGLIIYPTDSGYTLGCTIHSKKALTRLYMMKKEIKKYTMTLMVHDFPILSEWAEMENFMYKYMKHCFPGPYTFILKATKACQKALDVKREEIGVRMPDHPFFSNLFPLCDHALLTTSVNHDPLMPIISPNEIEKEFANKVDLIIDMGPMPQNETTIISFTSGEAEVIRLGQGAPL